MLRRGAFRTAKSWKSLEYSLSVFMRFKYGDNPSREKMYQIKLQYILGLLFVSLFYSTFALDALLRLEPRSFKSCFLLAY